MAWPGTLPALTLAENVSEEPGNASYRTVTDSGPGKTRPRPDVPNTVMRFSQFYDSSDIEDLQTFYLTTLSNGSLTFTENHPRTGVSTVFRFVSAPRYRHLGGPRYMAEFTLEIML